MATEIKMPQLSDTMNSGKILSWNKQVGDVVKRGDILAEVETDKANLEIECFQDGTILDIRVQANSIATVGEVICTVGKAGESVSKNGTTTPLQTPPATQSSPASPPLAVTKNPPPTIQSQLVEHRSDDRVIASPLAKKIAAQRHIDLSSISGTGPNGRIVRKDVEGAQSAPPSSPVSSGFETKSKSHPINEPIRRDPVPTGGRLTPLSKMRDTIARRMQQSVNESPHFYVTTSVRMDLVVRLREFLKTKQEFAGISVNHFIIKACAYALQNEPRVNCAFRDNCLYEPDAINIGIITSVPDGLLIPVIKETNTLSLKDIVFEAKAAVERAKAGRPSSSDLTGGTFSISNMGMFDVENFTAIINPGQGGVIAISAVKETPIIDKGVVVPGLVMKATLSVDHRVIDGIMAAQFLKYFKEGLEFPAILM